MEIKKNEIKKPTEIDTIKPPENEKIVPVNSPKIRIGYGIFSILICIAITMIFNILIWKEFIQNESWSVGILELMGLAILFLFSILLIVLSEYKNRSQRILTGELILFILGPSILLWAIIPTWVLFIFSIFVFISFFTIIIGYCHAIYKHHHIELKLNKWKKGVLLLLYVFCWFPAYSIMIINSFGIFTIWLVNNYKKNPINGKKMIVILMIIPIVVVSPFLLWREQLKKNYVYSCSYNFENPLNYDAKLTDIIDNFRISEVIWGKDENFSKYLANFETLESYKSYYSTKIEHKRTSGLIGLDWITTLHINLKYSIKSITSGCNVTYFETSGKDDFQRIHNYTEIHLLIDEIQQNFSYTAPGDNYTFNFEDNPTFYYINKSYFPSENQTIRFNETIILAKMDLKYNWYAALLAAESIVRQIWFILKENYEILFVLANYGYDIVS